MKKSIVTLLTVISIVSFLAGGCASKSAVKKDDANVPAASSESIEQAKAAMARADEEARIKADADAKAKVVAEAQEKAIAEAQAQQAAAAAAAQHSASDAANAGIAGQKIGENGATSSTTGGPFDTVYFDFDKSDLRQESRDALSKNAEAILKSYPNAKIQIEGHCDERGSAEYNLALGERRAQAAQKYLTTLSVKADNLSTISYGKEKPAVTGNDEAAWSKNRRAEFVLVK